MPGKFSTTTRLGVANRYAKPPAEPMLAQMAGIAELFVWLLVLRGFFLPLFIIPTGSMAETLNGAYADASCPNCGYSFPVGVGPSPEVKIAYVECPNCRWQQLTSQVSTSGNIGVHLLDKQGDRIAVHGWPYVLGDLLGGGLGPQRWDVVVFRNPNVDRPTSPDANFIKRLIGLPGETIEIIDGDIWVTPPGGGAPRPARKPHQVQETLWLPRFNDDYIPRMASEDKTSIPPLFSNFKPRWVEVDDAGAWADLQTRAPRFAGARPATIRFVTGPEGTTEPGEIADTLGYNPYEAGRVRDPATGQIQVQLQRFGAPPPHIVTDVRLNAEIDFAGGAGSAELTISKYGDYFFARLDYAGALTLQHARDLTGPRENWAATNVRVDRPVHLSLGHADYQVLVEVDGRRVLESPPSYGVDAGEARARAGRGPSPTVQITAAGGAVALRHIRIDRDQYWSSDMEGAQRAVQGKPITLMPDAFLVLGDNSNHSADCRLWLPPTGVDRTSRQREELGSHLLPRWEAGKYQIGTVPRDQLIGQAFLVYWPGFRLFPPQPDAGRIRWIH